MKVLFDVLSDRAGRGDLAEESGLANTAVLLVQNHPGHSEGACLFSCIQFRSLFAQGAARGPERITEGIGEKDPLLGYVPHIQEIGVAGRRNFASGFPGRAIQRGTDFFF
jgi:hypothetical protein